MIARSKAGKRISCALKAVVILAAVAGIRISAEAGIGTGIYVGGSQVFMYFTIQSNLVIALICAVGGFLLTRNRPIPMGWYIVKLMGTVSILLTGVVFTLVLAPALGPGAWNIQNILTHLVVPAAAVADFLLIAPGAGIRRKSVIYGVIPPMLYGLYAGIGYGLGWRFAGSLNYPYDFLNWGSPAGAFGFSHESPYMGCVWWMLVLLLFVIAAGWLLLAAADRIGKAISARRA